MVHAVQEPVSDVPRVPDLNCLIGLLSLNFSLVALKHALALENVRRGNQRLKAGLYLDSHVHRCPRVYILVRGKAVPALNISSG
jgi:hypothetical protein